MSKEDKASFFQNKECPHFPCHKTASAENFNCLFCYCPLYALGERCAGNFSYLPNGVKDCSACLIPHSVSAREYITEYFSEITKLAGKNG